MSNRNLRPDVGPPAKKKRPSRCLKPFFGVVGHSRSKELDVRYLNADQCEKCAAIWPEKGLTTESALCFRCRLHILHTRVPLPSILERNEDVDLANQFQQLQVDGVLSNVNAHGVAHEMRNSTYSPPQLSVSSRQSPVSNISAHSQHDEVPIAAKAALSDLNVLLQQLGVAPLYSSNFNSDRQYAIHAALRKATEAVTEGFKNVSKLFNFDFQPEKAPCDDCQDLLQSFRKRYKELESKYLKYLMLTCTPLSMSSRKVTAEVGCSLHEAGSTRRLRKSESFNAFKMPLWVSPAHPLSDIFKQKAIEFYLNDSCSRPSPNVRDVRQVRKADGTKELGKEVFVEELQEEFPPFVRHHYIMKEQAAYIESLKQKVLTEDAIICYVDFAENYSYVQNAIQSFHWNNSQATIHPFVVTYNRNGTIAKKAYIVVYDALEHSAVTFHWFRSLFMQELKKEEWFLGVKKIYYVSDGAGSQYKNKFNFCNLTHHKEDFGIDAVIIFAATAHFKNDCDAHSGTSKSTAHRAAWNGLTILTPAQLYEFFQRNMSNPSRQFIYADAQQLEPFRATLNDRFEDIQTVPGTRKFHYVEPFQGKLKFKILAIDTDFFEFDLRRQTRVNHLSAVYVVGGFIAVKTNAAFVIGRVAAINESDGTVTLDIMKQLGDKNNFLWPNISQQIHANPICKLKQPVWVGRAQRYSVLDVNEFELLQRLSN